MESIDCGDELDAGGLIGPGLMSCSFVGISIPNGLYAGDDNSFFTRIVLRLETGFLLPIGSAILAKLLFVIVLLLFGINSFVVVDTMLLLLLTFLPLFALSAGEIGDIGGDVLLDGNGHEPNNGCGK